MEGTPASRSTTVLTAVAILDCLKYSPLNKAMDSEKGMQNNNANNAVISVPVIKGSAPKLLLTESHSLEPIKLNKPKVEKALMLWVTRA